jgi:hypothetical protein
MSLLNRRKKNKKSGRDRGNGNGTRKTKRKNTRSTRKGGAYSIPIRDIKEHYAIRLVNAHGEISPEIFYVVPDKSYLIMPNICGVPTGIFQTFTDPAYLPIDKAFESFRQKFGVIGEVPYTIFTPGDIIPMQTFLFDPTLPTSEKDIKVGFVGVFGPSVFFNNPFIQDARKFQYLGADNVFSIPLKNVNMFMFELLEYIRLHLNTLDKDSKGKPLSPIYRIYKTILDSLAGVKISVRQSLEEDTRMTFSQGPVSYGTGLDEYILSMSRGRFSKEKIEKIKYNKSLEAIRYLLPLIPENMIGSTVGQMLLENINKKLTRISINQIIEKTRDPSVDTYFVINACRSLRESKDVPEFDFMADSVEVVAAAAAAAATDKNDKYKTINTSKYSATLISKMNSLVKEREENPLGIINMKRINELRVKKGLKKYIQTILNYSELYKLFREMINIEDPGAEFVPMIESIKDVFTELESYAPKETVKATTNIRSEVNLERARVIEKVKEEMGKEKELLERRRKILVGKIRELKTMRSGISATDKEERLASLRQEIEEINRELGEV